MANQEYQVRVSADTKQAADKIDAVENSLNRITKDPYNISVSVDANALRRSAEETSTIASNIHQTTKSIKEGASTSIISTDTVARAASLAGTFIGLKRDVRTIEKDLGKALGKTNMSEFMNTDKFLNRIIEVSSSKTKEIAEVYKEIRAVPGTKELVGPLENFARSKAWEAFGSNIADQTLAGLKQGIEQGAQETKKFFYGDLFQEIATGTNQTIDTLARLGLAIQGIQLLVGPLAATWSAGFDAIIGQNVRLQETILSTQTTLASTSRVFNQTTGQEITDPLSKINALSAGVNKAIDNIRIRSLDIAGVTSSQIIDVFGIVATSISQIGGNLKDAEDLAISFTSALGTLGIPLYQARQEIGSILGGYITEDSLLAKRLQISNADINKAKASVDGVVGYLQKKLATAVAGQSLSSKTFGGILSNIQEVFQVITQKIGQPLLGPLVGGLGAIYEFLKKIQGLVVGVGTFLSTTVVRAVTTLVEGIKQSKLFGSISKSIESIAAPFESLGRSIQMGFGEKNTDLVQQYVSGLLQVPAALKPFIDALLEIGRFIKQQVELLVGPIVELLDQTRERYKNVAKEVVKFIPRATQLVYMEGGESFTKGFDTIQSTIQAAAQALTKFGIALVKIKIIEFTASIRAAATVFELFGSEILGKVNLALEFFKQVGSFLQTDFAKFAVSMFSVNKLLNNTEFFGFKKLIIWAMQTRKILLQLKNDFMLFVKGFRDAGNIDNIVKNTEAAYAKILGMQAQSKNPIVKNTAEIELTKKRLADLKALQQLESQGGNAAALAQYAKDIKQVETELESLRKTQEKFTKTQRAVAGLQMFVGGGAEMAQAKEAAREASVMASGAASAKALSSVIDTLGQRLGLTREQMKGLGGAARVAGKSLQTFLTTSMLINIGFTAASIGIAALITYFQQAEEKAKNLSTEMRNLATVNKILASGYRSILEAASGGDVAAQNQLSAEREAAQAVYNSAKTKLEELKQKQAELNSNLITQKNASKGQVERPAWNPLSPILGLGDSIPVARNNADIIAQKINEDILKNKKEQQKAIEQIYKSQQALNKLEQEQKLNEDFKLVGERRKEIEDKIKTAREDYNKELLDKEFQGRIEILNYEQQKRQEIANQEKAALAERFKLLSNNATESDRKTLTLLEEYQTAVLNSVTEEERRRSEMMQKQMQLRKEIEDYAFKMTRERVQLEKQIGNYKKEMEQYQNRMQQLRLQKEVVNARAILNLQQPYFKPYTLEQSQQFVNAAVHRKMDPRDVYAYLQILPKSALGISGDEKISVVMDRLITILGQRQRAGASIDLTGLARDYKFVGDPERFIAGLRAEATDALNSVISMYLTSNKNTDISVPNLSIDWQGQQQRMRALNESLIEAFSGLQEVLKQGNAQEIQRAVARFADPSLFTDIKADYTNELEQGKLKLNGFILGLKEWNTSVATTEQELDRVRIASTSQLRLILKTRLKEQGIDDKRIKQLIDDYMEGKFNSNNPFDSGTSQIINSVVLGANIAKSQIEQNFTAARQADLQNNLVQSLTESFGIPQILNARSQAISQVTDKFNTIKADNTSEGYSLAAVRENINKEVESLIRSIIIKIGQPLNASQLDIVNKAAEIYKNALLQQANALNTVNKALEDYQKKLELAKTITDTIMQSTKTLYTDILSGSKSVSDAMQSFAKSISDEFLSISLDAVLKPMKENLFAFLKDALGVNSAEQKAQNELITAQNALTTATGNLQTSIDNLNNTITNPPTKAPAVTTPTPPEGGSGSSAGTEGDKPTGKVNPVVKDTITTFEKLTKAVGIASQAFVGISMGIAGVQQMKKGGTYNTLIGLAGIFGSLGMVTGMFGKGGSLAVLFGGARASGGPIRANRPYLVGEQGPELFMSKIDGQILSNGDTQGYFAQTRAALTRRPSPERDAVATLPAPAPIDIRFESQTINSVEYVTAEQHRKGMEMAAKRGQLLAYQGLQHSVKVRRRLGI